MRCLSRAQSRWGTICCYILGAAKGWLVMLLRGKGPEPTGRPDVPLAHVTVSYARLL